MGKEEASGAHHDQALPTLTTGFIFVVVVLVESRI